MASPVGFVTYRPCWLDHGRRVPGPDEDVVTMAVAAAQPLAERDVTRIVLVSRQAAAATVNAAAVLTRALRLGDLPVETRLGGAAATVDALVSAAPGTLVVAVEAGPDGSAAAVQVAEGDCLADAGRACGGFPIAEPTAIHDDPRLLRERAWRPALAAFGEAVVAGVPAPIGEAGLPPGAPSPIFALAAAEGRVRIVGVDGASASAVDADPHGAGLVALERALDVSVPPAPAEGEIPISLSAFDRAFESKVGLKAARCRCGALSVPPRRRCLECGAEDETELVPLTHTGEVYSVVTVHAPVPGKRVPYTVALVELDGVSVRLLAPVTDAPAGSAPIGTRGELVLRRMAERQGIVDYGYAFQPAEVAA